MTDLLESIKERHDEARGALASYLAALTGEDGRIQADESQRAELKRLETTSLELRAQFDAERELRASEEDNPSTVPISSSGQYAEDAREVLAALDSILKGSGSEGPAQGWRAGQNKWHIPAAVMMRAAMHLQDQRTATGQAAMPTRVGMGTGDVSAYVRAMGVMGGMGVIPDAGISYGDALYAWVTSELPAANTAEDTSLGQIATNATTFDRRELDPVRTMATRSWTGESRYTFELAEATLLLEAMSSLWDQWEAQAVNGDGSAPNFQGVFGAAAQAGATNAAVDTAATISAAIHGMVDGTYCATAKDIALVMPASAYAWLASIPYIAVGSRSETSLIEWIESRVGSVRVSAHAPAVDTSTDERLHSIIAKCGSLPQSYAWPMWDAMEVVTDSTSAGGTRVAVQSYSHLLYAGNAQGRSDWRKLILREATA